VIVSVNGERRELPSGASVRDAALAVGVDPERRGVAVAVDGEVVPRGQLGDRALREGERIEVVAAIQGGAA
jgi:sulfur carrier protein